METFKNILGTALGMFIVSLPILYLIQQIVEIIRLDQNDRKQQKQIEREVKKIEREIKKIEREIKKMEREVKKSE